MPYIRSDRRPNIDNKVSALAKTLEELGDEKGDLNYAITRLIIEHIKRVGICYNTMSDITGVLNDVKSEFERRVVAPYEDLKCIQNGDVYDDAPRITEQSLRKHD